MGIKTLSDEIHLFAAAFGLGRERASLRKVSLLLHELEETISVGLLPAQERWDALESLHAPWKTLAVESLRELRSQGGALLPTLKRLRSLALEHDAALADAKARSSQALAQAFACAVLVPLFGFALYLLLPGLTERVWSWGVVCVLGFGLSCIGAVWMLSMAESARWGGLAPSNRPWVLASQCAVERFLALVRAGNPADLAWARSLELLSKEAPSLGTAWGHSFWESPAKDERFGPTKGALATALSQAGESFRKAVQVSVMEGRPCTERVEVALYSLRQEIRSQMDRELSLLGTRALKPLFVCVAPAILGLLAAGIWMSWEKIAGGF